ncbi:MAG: Crp/Fnr family transcriptional regulator [Pseudomonadota bacterium]
MLSRAAWSVLEQSPLLSGLDEADREELLKSSEVVDIERDTPLFEREQEATHLYWVVSGWVKVYRTTAEGEETVIHTVGPGESFAEPAALGLGFYPASAVGACEGRVVRIPTRAYRTLLLNKPEKALAVIGRFSQRLRQMVNEREQIQSNSTAQRLARFLLEHSGSGKAPGQSFALPYDKTLLAARLAMKPESLSRAFARLREEGVSSRGQWVTIEDRERLAAFVGR